jgi:hypothetical protein
LVHSGNSGFSSEKAWPSVTVSALSSGTARKAPMGPHSQVQKAIARKTANGSAGLRFFESPWVEADALRADWDFSEIGAHFRIETVPIHAEIGRRVAVSYDAGQHLYTYGPGS